MTRIIYYTLNFDLKFNLNSEFDLMSIDSALQSFPVLFHDDFTLNLSHPIGGFPYRIPLNDAYFTEFTVVSISPCTGPLFVITTAVDSDAVSPVRRLRTSIVEIMNMVIVLLWCFCSKL